jgi:EAL domain-containing protein (putative c-di-GMP-specific phosphodiesterase class I)
VPTDHDDYEPALARVLAGEGGISGVLQPIVDLRRGSIVGHELLSRFDGPPQASPDRWFAAADRLGVAASLTATTIRSGLDLLDRLPPNTFLTINLEPPHLDAPEVVAAFDRAERLDRLVLELTEHAVIERPGELLERLAGVRRRGARLAIDDAGAGYAVLALLLSVRPDIVKLDRELISGLDTDPVKRVLVHALGELAGSIDAWVLAEGIETLDELDELVALRVPLGQGYLLGGPDPAFAGDIPVEATRTIHDRIQRDAHEELAVALLQRVPVVAEDAPVGDGMTRIVVDGLHRPTAVEPGDGTRRAAPLLGKPSEPLVELARRAVARSADRWHEPLVLTDGRGTAVGVVEVRRLLERLATGVTVSR